METTTHSIDVKAPLQSVYDQWTQFEEFPRFMRDVVEVRQHGPDALSWKVLVGGKEKQWEARIIEQIPDTSIIWESVDGTSNRGAITFEPLGPEATRLTLVMEYEPKGFLEKAGDLLGVPSGHVEESLKSFRELIESKRTATAGWRGRIESTGQENTFVEKDMAREPATTSAGVFPASDEAEISWLSVPVTEIQPGEREADMVTPANDTDQELQNGRSMSGEAEAPSVKTHRTGNVTHLALHAVPVTDFEAAEHEAGMAARINDKEDIALNNFERQTANVDTAEALRRHAYFEPDKEEIARRAFGLYLARGKAAGHEMDDWIEAKRQLLEESSSKI